MSSHATSASAAYGLPEDLASYRLLTSDEAALVLCVPVATLRTWRSRRRGYGPRAVQVGGSVRADDAADTRPSWLRRLGEAPTDRRERNRWLSSVQAVVAYRDRYGIDGDTPLGPSPTNDAQRVDRERASAAARRAASTAGEGNRAEGGRMATVETRSL